MSPEARAAFAATARQMQDDYNASMAVLAEALRPAFDAIKARMNQETSVIHQTTPVQVWIDVDVGIAEMVRDLNTMEGVRTHASCQGTLGEGGAEPYTPYVMVSWQDERALVDIRARYEVNIAGDSWGYAHPRAALAKEGEA